MKKLMRTLALPAALLLLAGCAKLKLHDHPNQIARHPLGGPPGQLKRAPAHSAEAHLPDISVEVDAEVSRAHLGAGQVRHSH
jgi:hypothetical protein